MARSSKMTFCSFCGKSQSEVRKIIAGPAGVYICDSCVDVCKTIIDRELKEAGSQKPGGKGEGQHFNLIKPAEIKAMLDLDVVGQHHAKKVLSVAVYNHYKRLQADQGFQSDKSDRSDRVVIEKSNVLLAGPTGSGKTLLARTLADLLEVPFAIADATTLTEAGYVGEDVENIVLRLLQAADYDVSKAECGIIYVDEIDKIGRKTDNVSITRDVSGEGVQQALLKIVEGTVAGVPPGGGRKHPYQDHIQVDTTNILFICGGAFHGIEKIISKRVRCSSLGFNAPIAKEDEFEGMKILKKAEVYDLVHYGIIPELAGRLPVMVTLDDLSEEDLVHVLTEPKNALIKQFMYMFSLEDIKLEFTKKALLAIAREARKSESGARGLRSIVEKVLLEPMYDLPSRKESVGKIIVDEKCITMGESPREIPRARGREAV